MISTEKIVGYSRHYRSLNQQIQRTVKRRLEELEMTQRDLANEMGVTESRISMLLNEDNATIASWERVFQILGIRVRFEEESR